MSFSLFDQQSSIYIILSDGMLPERDSGPALIISLRIDRLSIIEADSSHRPQALNPHNIVNSHWIQTDG